MLLEKQFETPNLINAAELENLHSFPIKDDDQLLI